MRFLAPALLLPLAACMTTPDAVPAHEGVCKNDGLSAFVGQPATAELGGQIMAKSGATALRWVADGMMVTMDYRADRITVHLTRDNRVESVACG